MSMMLVLPDGTEVEIDDNTLSVETELGSVTAHRNKAKSRTIERWKSPEGYAAVRASYADEIQELENALWSVKYSNLLDDAFGVSLDKLGRIVDEGRDGQGDPSYRVRIRARILVNQSFGRPQDLLAVCALLDEAVFTYTPTPPAAYVISMSVAPSGFATGAELAGLLSEATALGVGGLLVMPTDPGGGFILGSSTGSPETTLGSSTGFPTPALPDGRFI